MDPMRDAAFWDDMYRQRTAEWDSEPNPYLPRDIEGLQPGPALDVGCGEGSDAVWLAQRGWRVTAVDISEVALDRGRAADTEHRVQWLQADVLTWQPPTAAFDLVTTHFLHFPPAERAGLFHRLAEAIRPGGVLLIVAHHPSDLETSIRRPPSPDLFYTAEEVAEALAPGQWEILAADKRPRTVKDEAGQPVTVHDAVLKARRLA